MIIVTISTHTKFLYAVNKLIFSLLFITLLMKSPVISQDLFNLANSKKYAEFLLTSRQYNLAAEEYERLVFMDPANHEFQENLIASYRKSKNYSFGLKRIHQLADGNVLNLDKGLSLQYLSLLIYADSLDAIQNFLKLNSSVGERNVSIFKLCNMILRDDYKLAVDYVSQDKMSNLAFPVDLIDISKSAGDLRFKSPFVASAFSALIPGTGKVYTGDYIDGIVSFLFVAGNAWQSYTGFSKHGVKSASGWIFGGLALGFYIGNIHGSAKSALKHNKLKRDATKDKVYNFLDSYIF